MADASESLFMLSDELTCSICLGTFDSPVTTPCGHNFCSFCLELTWNQAVGGWSCPQCRTHFSARPELRKNTVLATVVEQLSLLGGGPKKAGEEPEEPEQEEEAEEEETTCPPGALPCDSCSKAAAAQTCLTCIASFCQEHLRPHLESPAFAHHRLHSPLGPLELGLRVCSQHSALIEYFCQEHGKCLCCNCLVEHKACKTDKVPEAKRKREESLRSLHTILHDKIGKTCSVFDEITAQEDKVKDIIEKKKVLLKEEFSEINTIIQLEEQKVMKNIEDEEKRVQSKFSFTHNILHKKKKEFETLKDRVENLLNEDDEIIFLMKATKLNDTPSKDAFVPKIDCDHKLLHNISRDVYSLKEMLRNPKTHNDKSGGIAPLAGDSFGTAPPNKDSLFERKTDNVPRYYAGPTNTHVPSHQYSDNVPRYYAGPTYNHVSSHQYSDGIHEHRGPQPIPPLFKKIPKTNSPGDKKKPAPKDDVRKPPEPEPSENQEDKQTTKKKQRNKPKANPSNPAPVLHSRDELLKYAEKLSLDFNTAHKRILLTERNTKIAVTDAPQNYTDNPQRFTHCSQVLGFQGFARGIRYWEVEIKSSNFCGIGVSYKSIDRKGTESRLGRNKVSWCIEWFNAKLSAWHNDIEETIRNPNPDKIGVLLNCDDGQIIFFCHANKPSVLYKFQAKFTEAVYPAFWVFSSNTTLALCPLT